MSEILLNYQRVDPTTWIYLSSLLTIAIYFKFSRLWSLRNLDLIGLIALAPDCFWFRCPTIERSAISGCSSPACFSWSGCWSIR